MLAQINTFLGWLKLEIVTISSQLNEIITLGLGAGWYCDIFTIDIYLIRE
jgi:hypothetical protein